MPTLLGHEGGSEKIILLSKPFYMSLRTPTVGTKDWMLRISITSPRNFGIYLSRAADSGPGAKLWKTGLGRLRKT